MPRDWTKFRDTAKRRTTAFDHLRPNVQHHCILARPCAGTAIHTLGGSWLYERMSGWWFATFSRQLRMLSDRFPPLLAGQRQNKAVRACPTMLASRRPWGPGGRLEGEACEWGHLLASARTEWATSRFYRRMAASSSAAVGVTARKVGVVACWSCSQPRSDQHRPLSIASPTNTPSRMGWTARGRHGRSSSCEIAVKAFWCSRIPAASCSAGSLARRWRWDFPAHRRRRGCGSWQGAPARPHP
jgi:hypothetical protein